MKHLSLSELRALDGKPVTFKTKVTTLGRPREVSVQVGESFSFTTPHIDARGTCLSIDHGAEFPMKVEWFTDNGDKRITSFAPDEFITLNKE